MALFSSGGHFQVFCSNTAYVAGRVCVPWTQVQQGFPQETGMDLKVLGAVPCKDGSHHPFEWQEEEILH